jgi:hypothetical protein
MQDMFAFRCPLGGYAAESCEEEWRSLARKVSTWIDETGRSTQDTDFWFSDEGIR